MTGPQLTARLREIRGEAADLRQELQALADADRLTKAQDARFRELTGDDSPISALAAEKADIESRLTIIRSANPGSTESGEDRSFQHMKRTNIDVDVRTAGVAEVRSAANALLEREVGLQHTPLADETAALLEGMFGRRTVADDGEVIFNGDAIARRFLTTETDAYRSAWQKSLQSNQPAWTPEEVAALNQYRAAEQSLTNASGGLGVPVSLDSTIVLTSGADVAPLLNVARIEPITSNIWKGVSSAGVAFTGGHAEGSAVTATQATIAQPTITPEMAVAFVPFSFEIQGDYPNFANEMQRLIEQAYIDFLAKETETGAAGVVGIFTAIDATVASEVTPTTDGMLGPEDALKVWNALPERYRPRAVWNMNVSVESKFRVGQDGYGTRDLSSDGIGPLLGKRVLLSDYAPAFTGTTGAANLAILGDFSNYVVVPRAAMSLELVPHIFDGSGDIKTQRGYLAWVRVGADSIADEAFRLIQNQ